MCFSSVFDRLFDFLFILFLHFLIRPMSSFVFLCMDCMNDNILCSIHCVQYALSNFVTRFNPGLCLWTQPYEKCIASEQYFEIVVTRPSNSVHAFDFRSVFVFFFGCQIGIQGIYVGHRTNTSSMMI